MTAEQYAAMMLGEMAFQVASLRAENEALKRELAKARETESGGEPAGVKK